MDEPEGRVLERLGEYRLQLLGCRGCVVLETGGDLLERFGGEQAGTDRSEQECQCECGRRQHEGPAGRAGELAIAGRLLRRSGGRRLPRPRTTAVTSTGLSERRANPLAVRMRKPIRAVTASRSSINAISPTGRQERRPLGVLEEAESDQDREQQEDRAAVAGRRRTRP